MATALFSLVECKITQPNLAPMYEQLTFKQIAAGIASVDRLNVMVYLRDKYGQNAKIEIINVGYFQNEDAYNNYLKSLK